MDNEIIIDCDHATIAYRNVQSISYRAILARIFHRKNKKLVRTEFVAIDDVSFRVRRGETVGIVGANGAGKSTLLGAIAGIYGTDSGSITVNSDRCSLLALGVGFQPRLSGYQNIYLSGYAMGFTKAEIDAAVDEIIEFSELGDFIEKPVRTYSSGMNSKLGFAISSVLTPEVLLVDETLSVGDIRFQRKSFARMKEMIADKNRSVMIVNHSVDSLRDLCDRVLWLDHGKVMQYGDTNEVLDAYKEFMLGPDKKKKTADKPAKTKEEAK